MKKVTEITTRETAAGVYEKETRVVDLDQLKWELERTGLATTRTEIVEVPRDYPLTGISADRQAELEIAYLAAIVPLWAQTRHLPLGKVIEDLNNRIQTKLGITQTDE